MLNAFYLSLIIDSRLSPSGCPVGCIPYNDCEESDKGMFLDVKYFQLAYIDIPGTVEDEYLTALTLLEDATREELIQQAKVIRKNTTAMVRNDISL